MAVSKKSQVKKNIHYFRGSIIDNCVKLETVIEVTIADYFTSSNNHKTEVMLYSFLSGIKMGFWAKHDLLQFIIKNDFPELVKLYPSSTIEKIINLRNVMAHKKCFWYDGEKVKYDKEIVFESWETNKNGVYKKLYPFTKKDVLMWRKRIYSCTSKLIQIFEQMKIKTEGKENK